MKYDRRGSLKEESLDATLQIMINGPDVDTFDAEKYARLWVNTGEHLKTDAGPEYGGIQN